MPVDTLCSNCAFRFDSTTTNGQAPTNAPACTNPNGHNWTAIVAPAPAQGSFAYLFFVRKSRVGWWVFIFVSLSSQAILYSRSALHFFSFLSSTSSYSPSPSYRTLPPSSCPQTLSSFSMCRRQAGTGFGRIMVPIGHFWLSPASLVGLVFALLHADASFPLGLGILLSSSLLVELLALVLPNSGRKSLFFCSHTSSF